MEGEQHKKSKGNPFGKVDKTDKTAIEGAIMDGRRECHGGPSQNTALTLAALDMEGNIAAIREDIKNMATEMKSKFGNFRNRIKEYLKKDLTDIREEIQQ